MAYRIRINHTFYKESELREKIQRIINNQTPETILNDEDTKFMLDVFKRHPEAKIKNVKEAINVKVQLRKFLYSEETKFFVLCFENGNELKISWNKCLKNNNSETYHWKRALISSGKVNYLRAFLFNYRNDPEADKSCDFTYKKINDGDEMFLFKGKRSLKMMANDFIKNNAGIFDLLNKERNTKNLGSYILPKELESNWIEFLKENSPVMVHKDTTLKLGL